MGTIDEKDMLTTAVNAAMNSLRRNSGHSPAQAVWGRDPGLPGDVFNEDPHSDEVLTKDRLRAREHAIRTAACIAYFKVKNDSKLRRALN